MVQLNGNEPSFSDRRNLWRTFICTTTIHKKYNKTISDLRSFYFHIFNENFKNMDYDCDTFSNKIKLYINNMHK